VQRGLKRLGIPNLQAALVALDPQTGNILAMVGGADFQSTPFNRAVWSRRQPGSAFKPFVYAAALEHGMSPVSIVDGLQHVAIQAPEGVWIPRDDRARQADALTLREALLESSNAAAVVLQSRVGAAPVLRLANDLGVTDQPDVPSLALGSGLVSPLELTAAYAVFPTLGSSVRPRGIVSVQDALGNTVQQVHVERQNVLPPTVAFQMVTMLQDVIDRGTGAGARRAGVRGPVGGKTGTTSDALDAWFVGFSSSVVVGVWVGFDQPHTIRAGASAAQVALPIWSDFMRRSAGRLPARAFTAPPEMRVETLCRISHQRALSGCPGYQEYFKEGDSVPSALCPLHSGRFGEEVARATQNVLRTVARRLLDIFR
jgi:penicillin-binding protein 1A